MSCDDCIAESELLQEHERLQGQVEQFRGKLKEQIANYRLTYLTGETTEGADEKLAGLEEAADLFVTSFKLPFL